MVEAVGGPQYGSDVYIAPTAYVAGDVTFGNHCSVWHQVVIRGDVAPIRLGARVNVQDGTIIHTKTGVPLTIADDVGIGHRAVVHCKSVGSGTLIGIGAIVLDDAEIGADCVIAAGAVVPPGRQIPAGKVVAGVPGRVLRDVTDADRAYVRFVVQGYVTLAQRHARGEFPRAQPR